MDSLRLLVLVIGFHVNISQGLVCLKCHDVVQPRHCMTAISCAESEVCYAERTVNDLDEVAYTLGCTPKQTCSNSSSTSQFSRCKLCCDSPLCNNEACGEPGYPAGRGLLCFNCHDPVPAGRCHNIDFCGSEEVCSVAGREVFGTMVFSSKCQFACETHHSGEILIGRRQISELKRRSGDSRGCTACCSSDLCNDECVQLVDGDWGSWVGWTNCDTKCERGKQFRTRMCNNPAPLHGGANCTGEGIETKAFADCWEIKQHLGKVPSGVFHITTWKSHQNESVYCDMNTDHGGWTVFQHRVNGSVDFYQNFSSFENGFGSLQGEFWLGLKLVYEMTSRTTNDLRIDIARANDSTAFVVYTGFSVGAGTNYTLHVDNSRSESGLAVLPYGSEPFNIFANSSAFSTFDHDNDVWQSNCALVFHGAWWYNHCMYYSNLNGHYYTPGTYVANRTAMTFDSKESLKTSKMMFRPTV
ncbi:uncharacterized protein LOC128222045 [Mya arenaria]|uniref:uncharacterized protein LOC128222045 n=1 Tax=Mya arenaria TaxID=6604 RepID=UPI0022DE9C56|nr:uncharacterized protein LOC128222045 [Mya arenaria]